MDIPLLTSHFHANFASVLAAGGIAPDSIFGWFTNSIFVAIVVVTVVLLFTRMATKRMERIPGKKQNFVEFLIEFVYGQVENIVGPKVAPKAFPILATIFIFVLVSNYSGLMPGVGTMGFGPKTGFLTLDTHKIHELQHGGHGDEGAHGAEGSHGDAEHAKGEHGPAGGGEKVVKDAKYWEGHFAPLLRPPSADLNMTLGLAVVFMIVWTWITVREVGVWGFLVHTFGPKGGLQGFLKYALVPIFLFVGVIEIISIVARPVSLSLRLLGNIFAGETLLHTMATLGSGIGGKITGFIFSVLLPLPFYFMEILVGFLQATVFALLCAVYIQLSTAHDEEHH